MILRTPVYPYDRYKEADWQELLAVPYFKAALYLASKPLYAELQRKGFDAALLPPAMLHTLKKCFNRMCFRPTPFGLFSGVSTAEWSGAGEKSLVIDKAALYVNAALSFKDVLKLAQELLVDELAPYHLYQSNQTIYRVEDEYRYLRYERLLEKE